MRRKGTPERNAIPDHLPVREVVIEPEGATTGLRKIGEEVTETLEYSPASLVKRRTVRPKYAKKGDEGVLIAALPVRPLDKSPIKVPDSDKKGSARQGYQWVYHDPVGRPVLFNYRKERGQHGPKELLAGYQGYLQCDGYTVTTK